ncbi:MAG: hypothetical protein ACPIOQ_17245, partial [Promethearchaeia archaeon]
DFFSEEAIAAHPALAAMPYYHVKLAPGDAVSIPSGAYHAPLATSHDSVSINSFLAPSLCCLQHLLDLVDAFGVMLFELSLLMHSGPAYILFCEDTRLVWQRVESVQAGKVT